MIVVPGDPRQCGKLDGLAGLPGAPVNHLSLVQTVDRPGQCVVVAVALAAHRWLHASLGQALRVANRNVLRPAIRVMNLLISTEF